MFFLLTKFFFFLCLFYIYYVFYDSHAKENYANWFSENLKIIYLFRNDLVSILSGFDECHMLSTDWLI